MEQLRFFVFLFMQATLSGVGLLAVCAGAAGLFLSGRRDPWLFALPLIWLAPLALGGLFVEPMSGAKSASWLGYVAIGSLAAFFVATVFLLGENKGSRWPVVAWAVVNTPFAFLSALVASMASGGTWL